MGISLTASEAQIQNAILQWGGYQEGVQMWRINVIGVPLKDGGYRPSTNPGMADIHLTVQMFGIPVSAWLEVKSHRGRQSKPQKAFEKTVKRRGGYYFIVRSIEDVMEAIQQMKEEIWKTISTTIPF